MGYVERKEVPSPTGVGHVEQKRFVASDITSNNYADPETRDELRDQDLHNAYPFHDLCWVMLLTRLGRTVDTPEVAVVIAAWLFQIFHCLPRAEGGGLLTEHRYHGVLRLRDVERYSVRVPFADATEEPPVFDDEASAVDCPVDPGLIVSLSDASSPDAFSKFPSSVLHTILSSLPSKDVCHARLASRVVAAVSREPDLSQIFWASRFNTDREMGFVFAHRPAATEPKVQNWHQLYRSCKRALRSGTYHRGLRTRKRIWLCILEFAVTLEEFLDGESAKVYGLPSLPAAVGTQPGQWIESLRRDDDNTISQKLSFGTRFDKHQLLTFTRPHASDTLLLEVYLLPFNCRTYVSGFRISTSDGQKHGEPIQEVGFITSVKHSFQLQSQDNVVAIDVVMSVVGVHGLRFFIERQGTTFDEPVGVVDIPDSYVAVTRLGAEGVIVGVQVGFDVRKNRSPRRDRELT